LTSWTLERLKKAISISSPSEVLKPKTLRKISTLKVKNLTSNTENSVNILKTWPLIFKKPKNLPEMISRKKWLKTISKVSPLETLRITKTVKEIGSKIRFRKLKAIWAGLKNTQILKTKEQFGKDLWPSLTRRELRILLSLFIRALEYWNICLGNRILRRKLSLLLTLQVLIW